MKQTHPDNLKRYQEEKKGDKINTVLMNGPWDEIFCSHGTYWNKGMTISIFYCQHDKNTLQ